MINILIGTKNPYKARVMEYMLKDVKDVNIYLLKDTKIDIEVEEDGSSLLENAQKKAVEISKEVRRNILI